MRAETGPPKYGSKYVPEKWTYDKGHLTVFPPTGMAYTPLPTEQGIELRDINGQMVQPSLTKLTRLMDICFEAKRTAGEASGKRPIVDEANAVEDGVRLQIGEQSFRDLVARLKDGRRGR